MDERAATDSTAGKAEALPAEAGFDSPAVHSTRCLICRSGKAGTIEAVGDLAKAGTISWREAARRTGYRVDTLKRHMEAHVTVPDTTGGPLEELVTQTISSLEEMYPTLPPDVRPLLLVVIHNLQHLATTRPSQQHLIQALQALGEITGMKQQNRILLEFAKAAFANRVQVIDVVDNA